MPFDVRRSGNTVHLWAGTRKFAVPAAAAGEPAAVLEKLGQQTAWDAPRVEGHPVFDELYERLGMTPGSATVTALAEDELIARAGQHSLTRSRPNAGELSDGGMSDAELSDGGLSAATAAAGSSAASHSATILRPAAVGCLIIGDGRCIYAPTGTDLTLLAQRLSTTRADGELLLRADYGQLPQATRVWAARVLLALEHADLGQLARFNGRDFEAIALLPLPDASRTEGKPHPASALANPDTGVFTRIAALPALERPMQDFCHLQVRSSELNRLNPDWNPDGVIPCVLGPDESAAEALITAAGFYASEYYGQPSLRIASLAELQEQGEAVWPLNRWNLYSPEIVQRPGFPFATPTADQPMVWAEAQDAGGNAVLVPFSLSVTDYRTVEPVRLSNHPNLYGMGAGTSYAQAQARGLGMCISADAAFRWWCGQVPAQLVETTEAEVRVEIYALRLHDTVPICLAVIRDERGEDSISLGHGAGGSWEEARTVALKSAIVQWRSARDLLAPDSTLCGAGATVAYRADRAYRHAFGERWEQMTEPMAHVQYGLDPKIMARTAALLKSSPSAAAPGTAACPDSAAPACEMHAAEVPADWLVTQNLQRRVTGIDYATVDLTTADLAACGVTAVRVLTPELLATTPGAFPPDLRAAGMGAQEFLPYPGW